MRVVLDIKNEKILGDFINFLSKNREFVDVLYENSDLNDELKNAILEMKLMQKGILKKREISELLDEL